MEPPFVVYRDRTSEGVEVITSVPWEDNEKMRALARRMIATAFQGGQSAAQANQAVEGVFASALGPDADRRGYAVVMAYHLKTALAEMGQLRSQMGAQQAQQQQAQPQPSGATAYPSQQVGSVVGGQPSPSGGSWGIGAPPVGGGGGGGGGAPQQVQGVRAYSRSVGGGRAAVPTSSSSSSGGGGGRGNMAGAQNVRRQAGGIKTWTRRVGSHTPNVAAPMGDSDPWMAQKAKTAAALARRGIGPSAPSVVVVSNGGGGGGGDGDGGGED